MSQKQKPSILSQQNSTQQRDEQRNNLHSYLFLIPGNFCASVGPSN